MMSHPPARITLSILRLVICLYPGRFRAQFARSIVDDFVTQYQALSRLDRLGFTCRTVVDVVRAGLTERFRSSFHRRHPGVHPQSDRKKRGDHLMQGLWQDIRYALRGVHREPAFVAFAALIIGLGIGANTAVFSVMSPLLLRPLPFEGPDRLVWVALQSEGSTSAVTSRTSNLRDYRELNQTLEDLSGYFAFFDYSSYRLTGDGPPERLVGVGVEQHFLDVLGVPPLLGRNFVDEEGVWGGRPAVILTHGLWMRRFAGDRNVIGRSISLNDTPTEVVGVLPPTFDFASTFAPASRVDFLTPFPISDETNQWGNTMAMIGRLKPEASIETAQADFNLMTTRLREAEPGRPSLGGVVTGLQDHLVRDFRGALHLLAAAAGVVMLIACANLSNLLLARGRKRSKEMAVRSVLGAERKRLVRQLTVESLLLTFLGGVLGVSLAFVATTFVAGSTAIRIPMLNAVSIDGTTLLFTLGISLAAGLLVGIAPALQISHGKEAAVINETNRGSTEGRRSAGVREGLVVAEVALACVLLVGGGLLLRSFLRVLDVELGFQPENAVTWRVDSDREFANSREMRAFYDGIVESVASLPGVDGAGLADTPPLGRNRRWGVRVEGVVYEDGENPVGFPRIVDSRYLEVMRIPLLSGRYFDSDDHAESDQVVILNGTAAETLFGNAEAVGRNVIINSRTWRVVGVVGNVRHLSLEQESGLEFYLPYTQISEFSTLAMIVRSRLPVETLVGPIGTAMQRADPSMPVNDYETLTSVVDRAISPRRFILILLGAFAGTALTLAALGIYAVLSYSVSQRIPEIGIRMALGESGAAVRWAVVKRTLLLAGIGVLIGAGVSLALTRMMQTLLFGVGSTDALTFAGMGFVLLAVSAVAAYVPAQRASSTDPIEALRSG